MRSRAIILGALIGLIVGAVGGTLIALRWADSDPYVWSDDNAIAVPFLACILTVSSTAIAATLGNAIAVIRSERRHK
jgi:hypothetical protein